MNIKTRPLLIAAGSGAAVMLIYSLISNGISLMPMMSGTYDPLNPPPLMTAIGLLACLCIPIIDIGAGFLYSYLHSREATLTIGDGAIGGAASGAVIHIIGGIFGACLGLLVVPMVLQQTVADVPPDVAGVALAGGIAGGAIGAVIGLCIGLVIGLVLGAIGGAIGGATMGNKPAVAPV